MKWMRPSPSMVISLIALFVALGGTSYAAITLVPANSVGTRQLKNGAVSTAKLKSSVLKRYLKYGGTLPSGTTETGLWNYGNYSGADGGGSEGYGAASYTVPLATGLDGFHTIYVSGSSATHCSGPGYADPGYLCVYQLNIYNASTPSSGNIFNPESGGGPSGAGADGWAIYLTASSSGSSWLVQGTYAVTAP